MTRWLLPLLLAATSVAPLEITVDPGPEKLFAATWTGSAPGVRAGAFHGSVTLNGSTARMALVGRAEVVGERLRVRATLRYADVPADWMRRSRPDTFDYRLRGDVAGSGSVDWSGTQRWNQVSVRADDRTLAGFIRLSSLELTALSPRGGQGRAILTLVNPFSFPIVLAAPSCRLRVGSQEVGTGVASGRVLEPQSSTSLELPFTIDPMRFLATVGGSWARGVTVSSELAALLTIERPSGPLKVPLRLRYGMNTDRVRSGLSPQPSHSFSPSGEAR